MLAISWEMPPLSGPRAVQVTRTLLALGARGWQSRVICFGPRSNRYQQDYRVPAPDLAAGGVRLLRVGSPEEWLIFRALWRIVPPAKRLPDEKRVWLPAAVRAARAALASEPADVIVSFGQPWTDHLIGLRLHRETGLPWVAHFSDPWVDSPYQRGAAWQRRLLASMEHRVVEGATRIVFVNRYTRDRVMAKYPAAWQERTAVVPQGFEPADRATIVPAAGGPLRIVYTGRFYEGVRTPEALLQALAALHRSRSLDGRLSVEFVGQSVAPYDRQARQLGLDGVVRFTGRQDPAGARTRAAAADVLLTIDAPSDGPSLFLPSKLIDYLGLNKPILGLTPLVGPTADLLNRLRYPVVDPGDVTGIAAALETLLAAHDAGTLGPSAVHEAVAGEYDIATVSAAFARVLEEAAG